MWWWLAACTVPYFPPCGARIPIRGDVGPEDTPDLVRATIAWFEAATGEPVCLNQVGLATDLLGSESVGGYYDREAGEIWFDPVLLSEGTDDRALAVRHELCHLFDDVHGVSASGGEAFDPTFDQHYSESSYPTEALVRTEHFARLCENGPLPPLVAAIEESCGSPVDTIDATWLHPPPRDVRIATPQRSAAEVAAYDPMLVRVSDRLLASAGPLWIRLDGDVRPELEIRVDRPDLGGARTTIGADDQLWWFPTDAPPQRVLDDGTIEETSLDPRAWAGGWDEAGQRLWLWDAEDLDGGWVSASADGEILEEGGPFAEDVQRREFFVWDGAPAQVVVGPTGSVVHRLPDGEALLHLPAATVPRRIVDGVVVGTYAYVVNRVRSVQPFDLAPNVHIGGFREGEVWIDGDQVWASSPCAAGEAGSGGVTATIPRTDFVDFDTTLFAETVTWPVDR